MFIALKCNLCKETINTSVLSELLQLTVYSWCRDISLIHWLYKGT